MPFFGQALQMHKIYAKDALRLAVLELQRAEVETASLDARVLLQHVLGVSREQLLADDKLAMTPQQEAQYQELIDKRAARQPVSQLVGKRLICLDIPDDYDFMQAELIELLERKVGSFLR